MLCDFVIQTKAVPHQVIFEGTTDDPRSCMIELFSHSLKDFNRYDYQMAVTCQRTDNTRPQIKVTNQKTGTIKCFTTVKECATYYKIQNGDVTYRADGKMQNPSLKGKLAGLFFERI